MKPNGIFITGTDTGVGKTFIASGLASCMKEDGIDIGVMKPVATGSLDDVYMLIKASNVSDERSEINPIFLELAASPLAAKRILKRDISINAIREAFDRLMSKHEYLIVEGIGGMMVPITESYLVIDMIKDLGLPVLIVCRGALGTINHTLLTVHAALTNSIKVAGIVANMVNGYIEENAIDIIKELTDLPLLGKIPYIVANKDEYIGIAKKVVRENVRYDLLIT